MATTARPVGPRINLKSGTVLLYVVFAVLGIAFLMPFFLMLSAAFKTPDEIIQIPPSLLPQHPTLHAFAYVLTHAPFFTWYRNSLMVASSVTFLVLFTSSMAGYIFAKFDFPLKGFLFVLLLVTLMVPFPVIFIPNYLIVSDLRLLNTLWALIVPSTVSAFGVFMMRQHISGIPGDLMEAARMDGASEISIYRMVVLPLSGPMLAALGIFTFLGAWNDYLWPLTVINDVDKQTLPLALAYFNSTHGQRYDLVMASAVMTVIPIVIIFILLQRWIVGAFMLSGMKG